MYIQCGQGSIALIIGCQTSWWWVGEWTFNHSVATPSPHLTQQETAGPLSLVAWLSVWGDGDFYDK